MKYHTRRSIRLKGYDYSQTGLYFITICCEDRICRFGHIENGEMIFNEFGKIAHDEWKKLSQRFPNMVLDAFQIMPNHIHGIISLTQNTVGAGFTPAQNNGQQNTVGAGFTPAQNNGQQNIIGAGVNPAPTTTTTTTTVSGIVGAYKSLVANGCLDIYKKQNKNMGKLWQRNYFEHIIRNEQSYNIISEYIVNNPQNWEKDKFNF